MKTLVKIVSLLAVIGFLVWQNLPSPKVVQAAGTTYYVRTDGNNVNNGLTNSSGGAWKTITYAGQHVTAGDTIRVQAGIYVETAAPSVSGTSGNTVTLVADGLVTTCGMSFSSKSYIRVIGFTMDRTLAGCVNGIMVNVGGTNTGLEFWNNDIGNLAGKGIGTLNGAGDRCLKCIVFGGNVHDITNGNTALGMMGDDSFVGYVNETNICYIGVGPAGSRQRYINIDFSGFQQCNSTHPDFYYIDGAAQAIGFSNSVIESNYGIGTPTAGDNKYFHAENQSTVPWNDDVWRFNLSYNTGSAAGFSMYSDSGGNTLNRWKFYNNTTTYGNRSFSGAQYAFCGNTQNNGGGAITYSVYNSIFYQCWADGANSGVAPWQTTTPTADYNLGFTPLTSSVTWSSSWNAQVHKKTNVDPLVTNASGADFTLQSASPARSAAGPLTTATSCSGTTLSVAANTGGFFVPDNSSNLPQYGGNLVPGDTITVGTSNVRKVVSVSGDSLTLDSSVTCAASDPVYYGNSNAVDMGAYPYKPGGYNLTATYSTSGSTATIIPNDPSLVRFAVCYNDNVPTAVVNSSPYSCSTGSGTFSAKVYPKYASQTLSAAATLSGGSPNPPPPPTPIPGDINLDHIVNSIDYSILNSDWFTSASRSDLNTDGIVNAIDYSILNSNWFKTW